MAVRKEKRRDKRTDKEWEAYVIDFVFQHPDGTKKRFRKTAVKNSRRAAEAEERALRKELENGTYRWKEDLSPKLAKFAEEFIRDYAKVNNAPSEVRSKKGHIERYLVPHLGSKRLDDIRFRDVERLKGKLLEQELSKKTINNALGTLRKMLSYAEEMEIIKGVPRIVRFRGMRTEFDFLNFEEAEQLLAAASYNPDWYALIFVALRTGLRYGELCELRWDDLDLKNGRIMVKRSFTEGHVKLPKNNRSREIPLSDEVLKFLKNHRHLKSELVFCTAGGSRRYYQRADVGLKLCCEKANLRPIGWHTLRHTFASHLVMRGARMKDVQELLGHSTIDMTMRYAHLSPEVKKETVNLLDNVASC